MGLLKQLLNKKIVAEVTIGCDPEITLIKLDTGERFTLELQASIIYDDAHLEANLTPFDSEGIDFNYNVGDIVESGFMDQSEVYPLIAKQEAKYRKNEEDRIKSAEKYERDQYLKLKAKFEKGA